MRYVGHLRVERVVHVELEYKGSSYKDLERAAVLAAIDQGLIDPDGDKVWINYVEPVRSAIGET